MPKIDSTARVHPKAELADDVVVGPYAIIGEHVRIGPGTIVESHCVLDGHTELGTANHLYPFASVGLPPQDLTYRGEPTRLLIGDRNHIREFVTINTGTVKGGGITIIGNDNYLMSCCHVAHDCQLGDHIQLANCALIAGHVKIEDGVILSGHTAVHHFVTLGTLCMLGGLTGVNHDVPPYMMMLLDHHTPRAVNIIGMQRAGFSGPEIDSVQRVWRMLYRSGLSKESAAKELEAAGLMTKPAQNLLEFMRRSETGKLARYLEVTRQERGGVA
ncbi:MAG: acyl-ACP--UDP-N-acetylglucosamine O-acyltransferase [Candidatus Brocadiia bacterium]|jgi:UDP-N-acetylglucosamine acyltransferase